MSPPSDIHRGVDKQKNWWKGETTLIKVFIFFQDFSEKSPKQKNEHGDTYFLLNH